MNSSQPSPDERSPSEFWKGPAPSSEPVSSEAGADEVPSLEVGSTSPFEPSRESSPQGLWKRVAALAVLVSVAAAVYLWAGDSLTLESLAGREQQLRAFQQRHPLAVYGLALVVYVVVTGLSIPGATALSLMYGWYFGWLPAVILVSFASTAGATLAFLVSRYVFREAVARRLGARLARFDRALEREGPFYLFTLRLIPAVPFFVINAVMGLTTLRVWTFWWVSQLGMLPATLIYVYAGASVPGLSELSRRGIYAVFSPGQLAQIVTALALLGLFPLAARWIQRRWHSSR